MGTTAQDQHQVRRVGRPRKVEVQLVATEVSPAQILAARIFEGQSPDIPMAERIRRVTAGVEAQGYSMEGVKL